VLGSELQWVWLPCALAALAVWLARRPGRTARMP
jgi:inner membrane protein